MGRRARPEFELNPMGSSWIATLRPDIKGEMKMKKKG